MRKVVISGALANKPFNGGNAWAVMSWAVGLRGLGCDVYFLEEIDPAVCRDRTGAPACFSQSVNRSYFEAVTRRFGLAGRSALLLKGSSDAAGSRREQAEAVASGADLLVNISGHLREESLFSRFRRRAFIDFDPGYTQFWCASGLDAKLEGHHSFFTLAGNIGEADCPIPDCAVDWRPIRQPVVLSDWPWCGPPSRLRFTTVASWRGAYGRAEYAGRSYGQKAHTFRQIAGLPSRCPEVEFEVALDIHADDAADRAVLETNGWRLADPLSVCGTPDAFRSYVQASAAEVSPAQGVYVETRSGWFSDRTVRYLASGRPAIVQDTGFSRYLPTGEGLIAFRDADELEKAVVSVAEDYQEHARAARSLAERYFASHVVLARFLEQVEVSP